MDFAAIAVILGGLDLVLIGLMGSLIKHLNMVEHRLTRIETKLNIDS